jgi:hypothetical protein
MQSPSARSLWSSSLQYRRISRTVVVYPFMVWMVSKRGLLPGVAKALQLTRQSIYNYIELLQTE